MIIAIDESGSFAESENGRCFFVSVHLRQRSTLYKLKRQQFHAWEDSLPRALKNFKGEIKSSALSDEQLTDFARLVICPHFRVGITAFAVRPSRNASPVVEKYRRVALVGIQEGIKFYASQGKTALARSYDEFGHWVKKLRYSQYLKLFVLSRCIAGSLANTVGHAVTGGYEPELLRIRFLIDQDFIRGESQNNFWRELLRNQLYHASLSDPLPIHENWVRKGSPFLDKYGSRGTVNLNDLFWNHCSFVASHEHFEIRIADAVGTIIARGINRRLCQSAFSLISHHILRDGRITELALPDFDLDKWKYDPAANPWRLREHPESDTFGRAIH